MNDKKTYSSIDIEAIDGYVLKGRIYGSLERQDPLLLVVGATGVPQRYYKRFAEFICERGYSTITFDFRGIGESKYKPLRGFETSFTDWAELDLKAVLNWVGRSGKPIVIGHSWGGQAFGLLEESNNTLGLCTFGTGSGWHGFMPRAEMIKVLAMWRFLGPVLTGLYGYLPSKLIGIGENLPLGVYKQWKKWCLKAHHWFEDSNVNPQDSFSMINVPITSVNSTDDKWAPEKSTRTFMGHYDNVDVEYIFLDPGKHQLKQIGHMGYFHSDCLKITVSIVENFYDRHKQSEIPA